MSLLGIDIGGTRLKAGNVDERGQIIKMLAVDTPTDNESFRTEILSLVRELGTGGEPPSAIGIGCKGIIDGPTTSVTILPGIFSFLEGTRLSDLVSPVYGDGVQVFADNDARAALAGEVVWGCARGRKNVIMLTLGTGVGGAVLVDGKVLRGATGAAGLLGHVTVQPGGRFCDCGNRGCLETIFSANAIEAEALHAVHRGCESLLTERFGNDLGALNCKAVFDAAAEGDVVARGIRDDAVATLGSAIAGLLHVFDPEIVVLAGQMVEAGDALLSPLRHEMAWRTRRYLAREVPVILPEVKGASGIVGAAALARLQ